MSDTEDNIHALLIEDSATDAIIVEEGLRRHPRRGAYLVTRATSLSEGLERLAHEPFDLVLLDLNLPDTTGLESIERLKDWTREVPIVVLSGVDDEDAAIRAVQLGAQDYLVKSRLQSDWLERSTRYAVERHRLQKHVERERAEQQRSLSQEMGYFNDLARGPDTQIAATYYGARPLRQSVPEVFDQVLAHYEELIEKCLEHRVFKHKQDLSGDIRMLAQQLGRVRAGPRDLIDVHTAAMNRKTEGQASLKVKGYVEEGRFLLLELMGYLIAYYRAFHPASQRGTTG